MRINSYSFGKIVIDGESYSNDLIIFPDKIVSDWWRKEGHSLCPDDLKKVFEQSVDILIIGTGASGVMSIPEDTKKVIESKGIKIIVLKTKKACKKFNELIEKDENVAAGLHLTC